MNKQESSFTLIELLVVIAIIGILAGILIVSMTSATNSANDARRKADINNLVEAILIVKTRDGSLPADSANCSLGSTCTGIQARLVANGMTAIPKDPTTGNYYVYNRVSADDFTLTGIMSDSSSYAYDSSTSKYSSSSLTNGACGTSNNTITATTPTNTCSAGTSSSVTTDSNTVLLMHMDGTDNGTTFADQTGKTITRNGDAKTVTATKKFGTASAYFDGSSDYLSIPTSTDFDFGTGDFTIDFWINSDRCGNGDSTDIQIITFPYSNRIVTYNRNAIFIGDNCSIGVILNNSSFSLASAASIFQLNQWNHIAVVRNGVNMKIYYNGNSVASSTSAGFNFPHPDYGVAYIGAYIDFQNTFYAPRFFRGSLDEFMVTKSAKWTTNFTPPNAKYYWWNWNCNGSGGGTNATCGADKY